MVRLLLLFDCCWHLVTPLIGDGNAVARLKCRVGYLSGVDFLELVSGHDQETLAIVTRDLCFPRVLTEASGGDNCLRQGQTGAKGFLSRRLHLAADIKELNWLFDQSDHITGTHEYVILCYFI